MPKPPQGWRDFFGEVAVIVVGIGIALGGEEMLASWREHHQADSSLIAIKDELAQNLGRMEARVRSEQCITDRLNQIAVYIEPKPGTVPVRPKWVGRPQIWNMQTSALAAASSYGSMSLFHRPEQLAISATYVAMANFAEAEKDEQWAWADLRSITEDRRLSDVDQSDLRRALQRARYSEWILHAQAKQALDSAAALGVEPDLIDNGSRSVCIAMDTPFDEAVRQSGDPAFGEPH
ncbi:MAG: hypothetical protein ABIR63_05725 [Sphingomicrobium sp.]